MSKPVSVFLKTAPKTNGDTIVITTKPNKVVVKTTFAAPEVEILEDTLRSALMQIVELKRLYSYMDR